MAHGDRLAAAEGETGAEAELVAGAHGQGADGELGGVLGLDEDGDALAVLGLQAQGRLAEHDGVAIVGGEFLRLRASEAAVIGGGDLSVRSRAGGRGKRDCTRGNTGRKRTSPLGISMPKNCGMVTLG